MPGHFEILFLGLGCISGFFFPGHSLAFEVGIPQATCEYVQSLDPSRSVQEFFSNDKISSTIPGADQKISPAHTLLDPQTNNLVHLYPTSGDPSEKNFLLYYNDQFEYTCWIPADFSQVVLLPDNGDGLILETQDGQAQLRATGGYADFLEGGLQGSFDQAQSAIVNGSITHQEYAQDEWKAYWILEGQDGDKMFVRKLIIHGDYYCELHLSYPAAQGEKYIETAAIVAHNFNREIEDF